MSKEEIEERLNAIDKAFKLSVLLGPKHFDDAMTHIKKKNGTKFKKVCKDAGLEAEAEALWNYLKEYTVPGGGAGTGW